MRNFCFLLMFSLWLAVSILPAQNPYIHHYTTEDGLPSNTVYYIYQDSKKFIWFATDAGVSKYDGTTFVNYRKIDGLSSNEVIRIKEDSYGRVWFFSLNAAVDFFYQNKIHNSRNTPFLQTFGNLHPILDFSQDKENKINFANRENKIIVLDTDNKTHTLIQESHEFLKLLKINPSFSGSLFLTRFATADELILWMEGGIVKYNIATGKYTMVCDTFKLKGVFPVGEDRCYVSTTGNNLLLMEGERISKSPRFPAELIRTLDFITSVIPDKNGGTWVVTFNNGTFFISGEQIKQFDIKEGQAAIQDHEKNIWISSMSEGVYKINPLLFSHEHIETGVFENQGVLALGPAVGEGVWMTNGKSIFLIKDKVTYKLLHTNDKYTFNWIQQFNNTNLLIGEKSHHFEFYEGIHADKSGRQLQYRARTEVKVPYKKFNINKNGSEGCSFAGNGVMTFNTRNLLTDTTRVEVYERVYNAFFSSHDELVINAKKNYRYVNKTLLPYPQLSRFNNKIITDHLVLNDSTELFNVEGDSVYLFNGETFYNLTDAFGNPIGLQIRNITYHETVLYLSSHRNVYKCGNPLDLLSKHKVNLQILDVNFKNIHDILVKDDSLYIASDDGLTIIPEAVIGKGISNVPIPYIRSVFVNDQEKDPADLEFRSRGITKIAFTFGCVNYSSAPVLFAYKMEGLDTAWTDAASGNVVYQHLLSGNYTFKLKARKSTAEWSPVIEYPIQINASFWRHPLFFTFLAIVVLAVVALFAIRRKNIQIKQRELDHHLVTLELKSLQSMMNPHFIFNALGSIQNFLLQNKTGEAGLYLSQFARLIRQNMNAINDSMINLADEIDRLMNYLDLERLRLENKFEYRINIDDGFDPEDLLIPSMIIQPFVENSIWHGISTLNEQGFIHIHVSLNDENSLKITVEDNGIGIKKAKEFQTKGDKHLKLGMEMTRKRLELLGNKYTVKTRIEFSEARPGSENPGTVVVVVLPFSYIASDLY